MLIQTQATIEAALAAGRLSAWAATAYRELRDKIAEDAFPCTFGTVALKKGDIRFAFNESTADAALVDGLATALVEYAQFVSRQSVVMAALMPLAILMPPPLAWKTVDEYFHHSWRLLQAVHARDPQPWPERIPSDPEDPRWSFCFGGVPFFVNFKTPLHQLRRSRRSPSSYVWLVQARDGFDLVAGDTPQGRNARRIIREKLAAYDAVPVYPELAHFGTPGNREWQQYFVPETNDPIATRCPFAHQG